MNNLDLPEALLMKFCSELRALGIASIAGLALFCVGGCGSQVPVKGPGADAGTNEKGKTESTEPQTSSSENPLTVAEWGPQPRVVVEQDLFEFGEMEAYEERKHEFVIRNDGDAPLKLAKRGAGSTCKCTLSKIAQDAIPPGESAVVELAWEPKEQTENFEQAAFLWTNDPERQEINLRIKGKVVARLELRPPNNWVIEKIADDQPTQVSGLVVSELFDDFNILEVTGDEEGLLTGEAVKLTADELKEHKVKSGYRVSATVQPEVPIGPYLGRLMIKTDVKPAAAPPAAEQEEASKKKADEGAGDAATDAKNSTPAGGEETAEPEGMTFSIYVEGNRPGPIQFLAIGRETSFTSENMYLAMGNFPAAEGRTAKVSMFIEGEMPVVDIRTDPEFLKLTVEPDENFAGKTKRRYILTFEVPAGSPPTVCSRDTVARVTLTTEHPQAKEIQFRVGFASN